MNTLTTPVWQRRWFQILLAALIVLATAGLVLPPVVALIYAVQSVLLPMMIGVALAYAVNPLARWLERRVKLPRPASAVLLMLGFAGVVLGLLLYVVPKLVIQIQELLWDLPGYIRWLADEFNIDLGDVSQRIEQAIRSTFVTPAASAGGGAGASTQPAAAIPSIDLDTLLGVVFGWLGTGWGVVSTTVGFATYLGLAVLIVGFVFFFFLWKFDRIARWFVPFIPVDHRARTLEIVQKMDHSVSAFIRGRLIQATVIAVVLSVGWWWAGVPYWLLLGIGSGFLNLIPYAAVVGWPIAVFLAWLDSVSGAAGTGAIGFQWGVVVWPSLVYLLAQGLDGWVVEPLVQGKATNLDPLTVLLVVLVGGSLAGLLGLLIAIPTAACIKILAQEVLLPRLRRWAEGEF